MTRILTLHRCALVVLVLVVVVVAVIQECLGLQQQPSSATSFHSVQGVMCREVQNILPIVGTVTVLEATANAQTQLVDEALLVALDTDLDGNQENTTTGKRRRMIQKGDPYGSVLWPAAWATANFILTKTELFPNLTSLSVLEVGTGTGLVSLAVAMAGAKRVMSTDYEPLALSLVDYAATNLKTTQSMKTPIETQLLDICDLQQSPLPTGFDLMVAADIMYEPQTGKAMAYRVVEALQNQCKVIVGDSE
jgi:predicted nicotinamide N-methyase